MRRIRKRLAVIIGAALAAISLAGLPAAAQSSSSGKGDAVAESSRVVVPDPSGVVTNKAVTVTIGFSPPAAGESPCDWELEIEDDLQQTVKLNHAGGFSELVGFEIQQVRASLSAATRAYSETGRWWRRICFDDAGLFASSALLPEGEAVTIEELILRSIDTLDPPDPDVTVLPEGKQLVQLQSLFWIDPSYWGTERTDTQTAGRVSSTVQLVPTFSVWDPGNGDSPVECDGPGEVWTDGVDTDHWACGYTYRSVENQPFTLVATVQFEIEVVATIGGVPAPDNLGPYEFVERSAEFELGVREIQALETNG